MEENSWISFSLFFLPVVVLLVWFGATSRVIQEVRTHKTFVLNNPTKMNRLFLSDGGEENERGGNNPFTLKFLGSWHSTWPMPPNKNKSNSNKLVVMLIINHVKRKDAFQYLTVCWCHATTYSCKFMWLCIKYFKSYKGAFPETSRFTRCWESEITGNRRI